MLDIMAYTLEVPVNLVECTVTFSNEMHSGTIVIGDEFVDDGSGVIGHTYHYEYFAFIIDLSITRDTAVPTPRFSASRSTSL